MMFCVLYQIYENEYLASGTKPVICYCDER